MVYHFLEVGRRLGFSNDLCGYLFLHTIAPVGVNHSLNMRRMGKTPIVSSRNYSVTLAVCYSCFQVKRGERISHGFDEFVRPVVCFIPITAVLGMVVCMFLAFYFF